MCLHCSYNSLLHFREVAPVHHVYLFGGVVGLRRSSLADHQALHNAIQRRH